ncbi:MAG: ATP-binding cassette domain-containing protein, partial [Gaiellaceae bacterium]
RESGAARDSVKELQIRTPSIRQKIAFLSGGNQQKTIIARALFARPKVLILDEPTQGIDVGAKVEVFKLIIDHANEGGSVIVISSEIPELLGLSDRIVVMREGRIVGEMAIERAHWTPEQAKAHEERLLAMATGAVSNGTDVDA